MNMLQLPFDLSLIYKTLGEREIIIQQLTIFLGTAQDEIASLKSQLAEKDLKIENLSSKITEYLKENENG